MKTNSKLGPGCQQEPCSDSWAGRPVFPENIVISAKGWFKVSDHEWLEKNPPSLARVALWWLNAMCLFLLRIEDPWIRALRLRDEKAGESDPADFDAKIDAAMKYDPLAAILNSDPTANVKLPPAGSSHDFILL